MSTKALISRGRKTGVAVFVTGFFFFNLALLTAQAQAQDKQNPRGNHNQTQVDRSTTDGADNIDATGECPRQLASFESGRTGSDDTGFVETYEGGRGYDGF